MKIHNTVKTKTHSVRSKPHGDKTKLYSSGAQPFSAAGH